MSGSADRLTRIAELVMAALLAVMVILIFGNAFARYVFQSGLAASEEISRLAFVWMIFIGATVAVRERTHIGMDFIVVMLPRAGKKVCLVLTNLLILYALWLMVAGSWKQTLIGMNSTTPVTRIPLAVFAAAGLVAGVAMAVLYAIDLFNVLTGKIKDADLVQVRETAETGADSEPGADTGNDKDVRR